MNQKATSTIILVIILVSVASCAFDFQKAQATSSTVLYIEPASIINPALTPGNSFTVDVAVADVEFLFGWGVNMSFNADVLNFVNVTEGDFLRSQPDGTFGGLKSTPGGSWVVFGWSTIGDHQGVSGSGVLAMVEFDVGGVGESLVRFELGGLNLTYLVAQSSPNPPPDFDDIPFTAEDGYFNNAGSPTMYVDPPNITDPGLIPGTSFTVDIMIAGTAYDAGTEVHAWQVCMVWNPAVIDIDDSVVWGDFLDVPRIGWWGHLVTDAPAGQRIVNIVDGRKFENPSGWGGVVLIQDDYNSEWNEIVSVTGSQLTMKYDLANTYTMAANGGCYPKPDLLTSSQVNPTRTRMMAGVITLGPAPGVSGDGWLCSFTFHVQNYGETELDINYHPVLWSFTYIINTLGEVIGDDEDELNKGIGFFSNIGGTQYTLTIDLVGFGTTDPAPGAYLYDEDTMVPVDAIPYNGWMLNYWLLDGVDVGSADPYTVVMDANHTLTAFFVETIIQYTLTIGVIGSGTTSPAPGTHLYYDGTMVSVDALPYSGWDLTHWILDGVDVGFTDPYPVIMNSNHILIAVFAKVSPTLLYIDPPAISADPGDSFMLNVSIQDVTDLYAYSMKLGFDETILGVVDIDEGPFIREQTPSPMGTLFSYIIGDGTISVTCLTLGFYPGVHGSGDLFTITFNVMDYGESTLNLFDSILLDSSGALISHETEDGYFDNVFIPTAIYLNLSPNPVDVGELLTLNGILIDASSQPLSNQTLSLHARPLSGSWRHITSLVTGNNGTFEWHVTIPWTVSPGPYFLAVYYPGSTEYESSYNLVVLIVQLS